MSTEDEWNALYAEYEGCEKCDLLCSSRSQVVLGEGSGSGPIMVVGTAPALDDDRAGQVFVGDAGKIYMNVISKAWPEDNDLLDGIEAISDDETYFNELRDFLNNYVYWTNVVQCRPSDDREPNREEIKNCRDRLYREIYMADPMLIIAAGKIPASTLLGKMVPIAKKEGTIFDISIPSPVTGDPVRYPMLAVMGPGTLKRVGDQQLVKRKKGKTYSTIKKIAFGLERLELAHQKLTGEAILEDT